jgi:hypothetical protein
MRLGSYSAGDPCSIKLVRGYIIQQRRLCASSEEWARALIKLQRRERRRFVLAVR